MGIIYNYLGGLLIGSGLGHEYYEDQEKEDKDSENLDHQPPVRCD